ncbi:MAG: TlpA family protein disulfide reductase [Candidatus Brocadiaceae bacterium]|nr:TlpA family protein disulfide reductase [Candidatus Brocadiaceae bacterium]
MNRQFIGKVSLPILFVMAVFFVSKNSYAIEDVRQINLPALQEMLKSNKGKVVIVNLWATWCPPCRKEIPSFISLYKKYKQDVEIIGIAFDENGEKAVPPFVEKKSINYPIYLGGADIAESYNLRAYPTTIIYDKDSKMAKKHIGYVQEEVFDAEIRKLLN